jgi:hypothetical protein
MLTCLFHSLHLFTQTQGLLNVDPHSDTWHKTITWTQDIIGGLSLASTCYMIISFALTLRWRPLFYFVQRRCGGSASSAGVGATSCSGDSVWALIDDMCATVDIGGEDGAGAGAAQIQGEGKQQGGGQHADGQQGAIRRRSVHRFPIVPLVLLSFAHWLFFAFRHGSTVEALEFKTSTPMNGADFFCLLGGFVRSFMCPVMCFCLQSGQHDGGERDAAVAWPYALVWGCSTLLSIIVFAAHTNAPSSDGFVWTKVLWDAAGLLLMGYSLVKLVSSEPASVLLGDSVYFRLLQIFLYYTVYTSVNLTYHIYAQLIHSNGAYLGAAHTLLFLRIVLGYGTGLVVVATFGFEPEFTRWWMVCARRIAALLCCGHFKGGITLNLSALSAVRQPPVEGATSGDATLSTSASGGGSSKEGVENTDSAALPPQLASSAFPEPAPALEETAVHTSTAAL